MHMHNQKRAYHIYMKESANRRAINLNIAPCFLCDCGMSSDGIGVKLGRGWTGCAGATGEGGEGEGAPRILGVRIGPGANGYFKSPRGPFKSESAGGLDTNVESLDMDHLRVPPIPPHQDPRISRYIPDG